MPKKRNIKGSVQPESSEALLVYLISIADRITDVHSDIELLARALNSRLDEIETNCRCRCRKKK